MCLIKYKVNVLNKVTASSEMRETSFIFIKAGFTALVYWFAFSELNLDSRRFAQRKVDGSAVSAYLSQAVVIEVLSDHGLCHKS